MKVIVLDNYDSFVYNICDYVGRLGIEDIAVYRNDTITVDGLLGKSPDCIIISPGPGTPAESGISPLLIKEGIKRGIPMLGVCLGHQAMVYALGGKVVKAQRILHGKTSKISHDGSLLYEGIPQDFSATRYHSLIAEEKSLPSELRVTGRSETGEIMSIEHKTCPCYGVQFHPESILTEYGLKMISNFIKTAEDKR